MASIWCTRCTLLPCFCFWIIIRSTHQFKLKHSTVQPFMTSPRVPGKSLVCATASEFIVKQESSCHANAVKVTVTKLVLSFAFFPWTVWTIGTLLQVAARAREVGCGIWKENTSKSIFLFPLHLSLWTCALFPRLPMLRQQFQTSVPHKGSH